MNNKVSIGVRQDNVLYKLDDWCAERGSENNGLVLNYAEIEVLGPSVLVELSCINQYGTVHSNSCATGSLNSLPAEAMDLIKEYLKEGQNTLEIYLVDEK